ncbi:hypothetical protein PUN28_017952 [Cardiocondyla obscurior]|uniref:Uncharacterized protein n=1 Tax=Cardiocondyla obscurior TaxID=286306 RepID=A0AAW2EJR2_9HYME
MPLIQGEQEMTQPPTDPDPQGCLDPPRDASETPAARSGSPTLDSPRRWSTWPGGPESRPRLQSNPTTDKPNRGRSPTRFGNVPRPAREAKHRITPSAEERLYAAGRPASWRPAASPPMKTNSDRLRARMHTPRRRMPSPTRHRIRGAPRRIQKSESAASAATRGPPNSASPRENAATPRHPRDSVVDPNPHSGATTIVS